VDVKVLAFDIFGTTVDWWSGVSGQVDRIAAERGVELDGGTFADDWRRRYLPSMDQVRRGELPWQNLDALHRRSLNEMLHERSVGHGANLRPVGWPGAQERDAPVVVQVAGAAPNGYALPWAHGGVPLDRATIGRKIAESHAAATLLGTIFDAGDDDDQTGIDGHPGAEQIATLDAAHSALLRALAARKSCSRTEFAELAAAHGVLPEGALDVLNDVAIETTGAPVVADGDTLAIDNDVLVELLA